MLAGRLQRRIKAMADILFKTDDYIFSYRVGGLLIHNGKVLMQKLVGE